MQCGDHSPPHFHAVYGDARASIDIERLVVIEPESGVAVSLTDCEELARERGQDCWTVAGRFAERMLPRIFRSDDPALAVPLAPEARQALERLLESLPPAVFAARDSLGWTYQFWQAERKEAVNKSGVKIGADELPAVTQLFTERYMVLFLLHNTVGAWRAGRVLAAHPELAATAANEDELRRAVRLEAAGGYDFSNLRFVREPREGDDEEQPTGPWRPTAEALRVLDPCCGSGHFLVECLDLLARLRMEEERLAPADAVEAVLRDNLFGLEIDPRCTQIAAFNLALAAWTWPGADGHRPLPALNLACSGLAPNATRDDWTAMAEAAADAGGLPARRDLLGVDDSLMSAPLRNSLGALHDLFAQAPVLGSLIDPRAVQADLFQHDFESARALLGALLDREGGNDEQTERAVAAQGMARAAELLAGRYHLVVTNVPYLARGKQGDSLKHFARDRHPAAKGDLATLFVSRGFGWLDKHGAQALVTPQNWLFLTSYRKLREMLLKRRTWNLVARLGPGAFETIGGHVVNVALTVLSAGGAPRTWPVAGLDVSAPRSERKLRVAEKAALLRGESAEPGEPGGHLREVQDGLRCATQGQVDFLRVPDAIVSFRPTTWNRRGLLGQTAKGYQGLSTGDRLSAVFHFWETCVDGDSWIWLQDPPTGRAFSGRQTVVRRAMVQGEAAAVRGRSAWRRDGVAFSQRGRLVPARYSGELFSDSTPVVVPHRPSDLAAVWCFCVSGALEGELRALNPKLSVNNGYFSKVPFDVEHWETVARDEYPHGLPEPHSDDPTQWIFHGHPCGSVVWDRDTRRTRVGPPRVDAAVLQVAVARLLGYRWPAERDPAMRLAGEARTWAERSADLAEFANADGIVCLSSLGNEPGAADRLRRLLAAAYGADWSFATERKLLLAAADYDRPAETIEAWLRDRFFEAHCRLFQQRPFVWQVWDGRRDGFHALLNYHRLTGADGEGRRTLEALTYRHLGEWIARQGSDRDQGVDGADDRLAAAQDPQNQLARILVGEPPCDLFVRWKPLREQPIGWEPDIDDGVRVNIRPFMSPELAHGGRVGGRVPASCAPSRRSPGARTGARRHSSCASARDRRGPRMTIAETPRSTKTGSSVRRRSIRGSGVVRATAFAPSGRISAEAPTSTATGGTICTTLTRPSVPRGFGACLERRRIRLKK